MDIGIITMKHLEEKGLDPKVKTEAFSTLDDGTKKRLMLTAYRCGCTLDEIILDLLSTPPVSGHATYQRKVNVYASEDGLHIMVTINNSLNAFVPSVIDHPTEKGVKLHTCYGLNPQSMTPEYEWYKPTSKKEIKNLTPDVKAYINSGGAVLRKIGFNAASMSDQIKDKYRKQRIK